MKNLKISRRIFIGGAATAATASVIGSAIALRTDQPASPKARKLKAGRAPNRPLRFRGFGPPKPVVVSLRPPIPRKA